MLIAEACGEGDGPEGRNGFHTSETLKANSCSLKAKGSCILTSRIILLYATSIKSTGHYHLPAKPWDLSRDCLRINEGGSAQEVNLHEPDGEWQCFLLIH